MAREAFSTQRNSAELAKRPSGSASASGEGVDFMHQKGYVHRDLKEVVGWGLLGGVLGLAFGRLLF